VGASHAAVVAWIAAPASAIPLLLLLAATLHHAQLGVQVVIEDYVDHEAAKLAAIALVKGAALVLFLIASFAVLKIALSR
jgi:succinate dehydrogenase / fumarate reductase membrane anchor subunit